MNGIEDLKKDEMKTYHRRLVYIVSLIIVMLLVSSVFYSEVEKWRFIDALYFSAVTMTTVGYGDLAPQTDIGKLFTIAFVFTGVGIVLYGLSAIATHLVEMRQEFWLQKLGGIPIERHKKTLKGIVRNVFHFDKENLVNGGGKKR